MAAAAALLAAQAQALPAASEWAYEELTNHLAMIVAKGGTSMVALPRFKMVLPGDAGSEAFADDFAALRDTDGYAVRRRGVLRRRQPEGARERRPPLARAQLRDSLAASEGRDVLLQRGGRRRARKGGLRLPRPAGVQDTLSRRDGRRGGVEVEGAQRGFRHVSLLGG